MRSYGCVTALLAVAVGFAVAREYISETTACCMLAGLLLVTILQGLDQEVDDR